MNFGFAFPFLGLYSLCTIFWFNIILTVSHIFLVRRVGLTSHFSDFTIFRKKINFGPVYLQIFRRRFFFFQVLYFFAKEVSEGGTKVFRQDNAVSWIRVCAKSASYRIEPEVLCVGGSVEKVAWISNSVAEHRDWIQE